MKYLIYILLAVFAVAADAGNCDYPDDLDSRGHVCGNRAKRGNL
jgi:uncharacterized membrane protein